MSRVVVVAATANRHKVAEIAAILGDAVELRSRPEGLADVVEEAPDLEGNARLKAAAVHAATGQPALADDTGLEVDALGGRPGVRSARYAGEHATDADNVALLLRELEGVDDRTARFHTVALLLDAGGELLAHGWCTGRIAGAPRGDGGFGYDPVFVPAGGDGRTFAEMSADEKNAISHRAQAFRRLAADLGATAGR